ncbi:MAG: PAS domain S-box protein [Chloroflexota bacterium]|nr:PAS domain S-box protein [Chloroflexota bacterium]
MKREVVPMGPNILIVDDEVDLVANLRDILEDEGYTVDVAYDGAGGLALCRDKTFDVSLVDINLPDVSGHEFVEEIAAFSPQTECVFITAYASLESAIEAVKQERVVAYEVKPLDVDRTLTLLREVLKRKQAEEALRESEERYRRLVESSPDAILVHSEGQTVFVNSVAAKLLGAADPEELIGKPAIDLVHPDYRDIAKGRVQSIYRVRELAPLIEEKFLRLDGQSFDVEVAAARISYMGQPASQVIFRDITARKRAEKQLRTRERFLECLSEVSEQLLRADDLAEVLPTVLRHLGETAQVSRTYLFENHLGSEGELLCSQRYEWCAPGVEPQIDNSDLQDFLYYSSGPGHWEDDLARGDIAIRSAADVLEIEQSLLKSQNIRSLLLIPIFVSAGWYGFIGFDICDEAREWQQVEIDLLRAAASDIASGIERERARRQAQALAEAAAAITATLDFEQVLDRILEQVSRVVPNDAANVMLIEGYQAHIARWRGYERHGAEEFVSTAVFHIPEIPNFRQMVESCQPVIISDTIADPNWVISPQADWIRSCGAAPIVVRGEAIGFLNVDSAIPGFFTPAHAKPLRTFANHAAAAIENARLFEQAQQEITERRQAEKALRVSEEKYRILFDSSLTGTYMTTSGGRILATNEAGATILGFDRPEDLIDKNVTNFYKNPRERNKVIDEIRKGGVAHFELEMVKKDGVTITVWISTAMVEFQGEKVLLTSGMDITERKQAEEALKRRATQLATLGEVGRQIASMLELDPLLDHIVNLIRAAFNYHYVTILLVDSNTRELTLKAGAGYKVEPAKSLRLKVGEESICGWAAANREPLLANDVSQEPRYYPVAAPTGTRSELAVPIQLKGRVIGVLDVQSTELDGFDADDLFTLQTLADQVAVALENAELYQEVRNHAEELEQRVQERTAQLQAQYARLDAILRSASDGILVINGQGGIIRTNPVAQTWLTQTLPPEDAACLQDAVREMARQADNRPETVLELTGLDLELKAAPISEPGMERAAVVAIHDVSHLKALDRLKSRFVSNVSHELRTPVTTIKLYAHLMQQRPENWSKYLDVLVQEVDHQTQLVQDILQISRIDAGRLEINPQPILLNELTGAVTTSHLVLAQDRGLALKHHPTLLATGEAGEGGPVVLVDPERTMQVLNNLVRNAIHYTPTGGKVTISTGKEQAADQVWATVTVSDTGMGIPEEELPHIFERFFRGERPRLMQITGTGLGLAIVKEIVELHGGRVTVKSKVDSGSIFTVWLPLAG